MAVISEIKLKQLPKEYQEVEFIKGNGTEYIDLGLKMTSDTKIEVKTNLATNTLVGVAQGTNVFALAGDAIYEYFRYYAVSGKQLSVKGDPRTYVIDQNKIYINGTLYYTENNFNYVDINLNLFLLARNVDGEASSFRAGTIWYFKMYQGGVLVRNMIPCYRIEDNEAGLYDLVENKFYSNAGEGAFSVGEDVNKYMTKYGEETIRNINLNGVNYHFAKQKEIYLPKEYQRVKYIEGTGTQYIKTGFKPQFADNGYRIEVKFATKTLKNYESILGCRSSSTENRLDVWWGETGAGGYGLSGTLNNSMKTAMVSNTYYNLVLSGEAVKNGVVDTTNPLSYEINSDYELYVFATNTADSPSNIASLEFYGLDIYQGKDLALCLIPCYRKSDNVVGVYDVISETFLTNAGTGDFVKGDDVFEVVCEDAVQEPLIDMQIIGESKQQTYTGKNLYNFDWVFEGDSRTSGTVTYTKTEEGILVNGSSDTSVCSTPLDQSKELKDMLEVGKTYTLSASGEDVTRVFYSKTGDTVNWNLTKTITGNEDTIKVYLQITKGIVYENVLVKLQLEEGNSATEYEPYVGGVASPNPEYPQEVESVGEKTPNLFTFYGRTENNFDGYSNPTNEKNISENQYTIGMARNGYVRPNQIANYDISNSKDIVVNTMSSGYGISLNYKVVAGENYYVQLSEWENCYVGTSYYDESGINIGYGVATQNTSFTMPEGCSWLYLCLIPRETSLNVDVHFKDLLFYKQTNIFDRGEITNFYADGSHKVYTNSGIYSSIFEIDPSKHYTLVMPYTTTMMRIAFLKDYPADGVEIYTVKGVSGFDGFNVGTNTFSNMDSEMKYMIITFWRDTTTDYTLDEVASNIKLYESVSSNYYEPYGYKVPIRVNGKNKYSANTGVYSGIRIISLDTIKVKPHTDYVISVDKYTNKEPMFGIKYVDEPVYGLTPQESWATGTQFKGNANKFNSGDYEYILIRGWDTNEAYGIDENTKIQIEEGTVATEYEPYFDSSKKTGKNLIRPQDIFSVNATANQYSEVVEDGRNCIRYIDSSQGEYTGFKFKENTQYTVSAYVKTTIKSTANTAPSAWFNFFYTDGTKSVASIDQNTDWEYKELTSTAGKTVRAVGIASVNYVNWIYVDVDTFQIEEGSVATQYEPYTEFNFAIDLYLNEPLRNIGKYFDYIDYKNKKVVRNVKEKIYQTSEDAGVGRQGTNYNSLVISLSDGLVFDSYSLAMSNYFQSGGNASAVYNTPDTQPNKIVYQGTYHRCFASISNQIVNSNSELQSWVETLYNNGTPLKILYPVEPREEAIDIPEIVMCKGTNVFEVDTTIKPSETNINYWKQI